MTDIDRLYRYKSLLTSRHAVPTAELMDRLGISIATLKRDMAQLRERLNLPVVYDRALGGYRLAPDHGRKELPGLWLTPDELVALATLQHVLSGFAPGVLADKLGPLKSRLAHLLHDVDVDSARLAERIRLVQAGQRRLPPAAFEAAATATLGRLKLRVTHHNRETDQTLERVLSPQQLVHSRDNWYLDAWCHLRDDFRSFAVDAMTHARVLPDEPALDMDPATLQQATQASYGIFSGAPQAVAVLHFSAARARWVSGEVWHPEQTSTWLADGRYQLSVPYSDDRELLGDILRHGPHCVVASPPALRDKARAALAQALAAYTGPAGDAGDAA
ncbi:MAG TPA: WYL domain-containing protein [Burkholderiaceae bacterium]|nr:WYL domain-containing protein [Burkholderiaceae bacterium]